MTLLFRHFDTRLNQWIENPSDPSGILTEELDNTLLEAFFPDAGNDFSFGHIDSNSAPEDLFNHPEGHVLLLSSGGRLVYGPQKYLERIEAICPDRKDRGAYGSIFIGACQNAVRRPVNVLIVDDQTGQNGSILSNEVAWRLVGDCHGKISPELSTELNGSVSHVLQHRLGCFGGELDGRFGKGTVAPFRCNELPRNGNNDTRIDLILPTSSFKGGDKKNNPIKPGLYTNQFVFFGEKDRSQQGKVAISQTLDCAPLGIKDFLRQIEAEAKELAEIQKDPRQVAQRYCSAYEQFQKNRQQNAEENTEENEALEPEAAEQQDPMMYRLIKADLEGHGQLLLSQKVVDELERFMQNQWRDLALGKSIKFNRAMIIPSKDLINGEICDLKFPEGDEILNFRSPYLNSNGMCISKNKHVPDALDPNGKPLVGVVVVNDETRERIAQRIEAMRAAGIETDEVVPAETESERQGRDFDGDTIGTEQASIYPNFTLEVRQRNLPENAYAPIKKEEKASFPPDKPFEEIAIFMSDSISVGTINNHATAIEALESEIDLLKEYGTLSQKIEYLKTVGDHYNQLIAQENNRRNPIPIKAAYRDYIIGFAQIANSAQLTPDLINQALLLNRQMYHDMVGEAGYQNQIAVDIFKSNRTPNLEVVKENSRLLHRPVDYIKDKKQHDVFLESGISTNGLSPRELIIQLVNEIYEANPLESRPTVQFWDLFTPIYTEEQLKQAEAAKMNFDELFNAASIQNQRLKTEDGPILKIATQKGTELEVSNLTHYKHPALFGDKGELKKLGELPNHLNIKLVQNKKQHYQKAHRWLVFAELEGQKNKDATPKFTLLGTLCEHSRQSLNEVLNAEAIQKIQSGDGLITKNVAVEVASPLSQRQVKLMFAKAYDFLAEFNSSIPEDQKRAMAAACWHLGTNRGFEEKSLDEEGTGSHQEYKISNFSFAAFPDEVIEQLKQLQFTKLTVTGINAAESNQHFGREWNTDEKLPVQIQVRQDLPPEHPRYNRPLVFVEEKEFAPIESRSAHLPIGTKALATVNPDPGYTIQVQLNDPRINTPIQIGKVQQHSFADRAFRGEQVPLTIGFVKPEPIPVMKLGNQVLGELDKASINILEKAGRLVDGKNIDVTLNSRGKGFGSHVIATTSLRNSFRLNKLSKSFWERTFNNQRATVTVGFKERSPEPAILMEGKVLGVLTQKESKEALSKAGLFVEGQTFQNAALTSNSTTATIAVDAETVEYPETWTKLIQTEQKLQSSSPLIEASRIFRTKLTQLPTLLFTKEDYEWKTASGQVKEQPALGLSVDKRLSDVTKGWLETQEVEWQQASDPGLIWSETQRGYDVLFIKPDSVKPEVYQQLVERCGEVLQASGQPNTYLERLESMPKLPASLLSISVADSTEKPQPGRIQGDVESHIEPVEPNDLPVAQPTVEPAVSFQPPVRSHAHQVIPEVTSNACDAASVVPVPPSVAVQIEFNKAQLLQEERTQAIAEIVHSFLYLEGKPTPTGAIAIGKSNTAVWDKAASELTLYDNSSTDTQIPKMRVRYEGGSYTPLAIANSLDELKQYGLKLEEVEHFVSKVKPIVDAKLHQVQVNKNYTKGREIER